MKGFLDNITGTIFSPGSALKKISLEKPVFQGLVVLVLAHLLPSLAGFRLALSRNPIGKFMEEESLPALQDIYPAISRAMPYIIIVIILGEIIFRPLFHFVFTAIVDLSCEFLSPRKGNAPNLKKRPSSSDKSPQPLEDSAASSFSPDAEKSLEGGFHGASPEDAPGIGLFTSMAFATLPFIFMVPVNLFSTLTGVNISPLFSFLFWIWIIALQVISVRETYRFSTGRAALAYFALPIAVIAMVFILIILAIVLLVPFL